MQAKTKKIKFNNKFFLTATILLLIIFVLGSEKVFGVDYYAKCDGITDSTQKKQCEAEAEKAEAYEKMIKLKEKQEKTITGEIEALNVQQGQTQAEISSTKKEVESLSEKIKSLERDIKDREKEIKNKKEMLKGLLQSDYQNKQSGIFELAFLDNNIDGLFNQSDQINQSGDKIIELMNEVEEAKSELEKNKNDLGDKKSEQESAKEKLEQKNLNLQSVENKKQVLLGQTQAEKEKYEKLLATVENEIYDLESGKSVDYGNIPAAKGGYFDYPVGSPSVTQGYGCLKTAFARKSYPSCDGGKGGFHNGIDFGKNSGTTIYAVRSGKIIGSGNNGRYAYGQWLAIDHGDGLVTLYGHLSKKNVSKGDKVKTGDKIGVMGTTGYSTGVHLHFTVFDKKSFGTTESKYVDGLMIPNGASVNPNRYLK